MKWAALGLLIAGLQANFLPALRPFGIIPNLAIVLLVYLALLRRAEHVVITAIVAGWLIDLTSGASFGLWLGYCCLVVLAVAYLRQLGWGEQYWAAVGLALAAGLVFDGLLLMDLARSGGSIGGRVGILIAGETALNLALAVCLLPLLYRLFPASKGVPLTSGMMR